MVQRQRWSQKVKKKSVIRAAGAALLLCSAASAPLLAKETAYDIVIRGGTIADGSGLAAYQGDVAIAGGHIVAVGDLGKAKAAKTIDAAGLVVAPGFINIHSHAEPEGVSTAVNMLTQGVTTEIVNADGGGISDLVAQLPAMASMGLAENIGAYVGFNAVWRDAMGDRDLRPTPDQISWMKAAIERNLKAGAWITARLITQRRRR
jgi:N-acyl-D-aspartate/D-glutamate deacylase